jgi:hypothetical protein
MPENKTVIVGQDNSGAAPVYRYLNVDANGNLYVNLQSGAGGTSFQDISGNPVLSTAIVDNDPNNGTNRGALIAAFNSSNTSYRLIRQDIDNRLPIGNTPFQANLYLAASINGLQKYSGVASGTNAAVDAAMTNLKNAEDTNQGVIISLICNPANATYTSFECVILFLRTPY